MPIFKKRANRNYRKVLLLKSVIDDNIKRIKKVNFMDTV